MPEPNNPYDVTKGKYAVYGLRTNEADGHTLKFLEQTDDLDGITERYFIYEACIAFDLETAIQLDRDPPKPEIRLNLI